jgi:hypothetical protein
MLPELPLGALTATPLMHVVMNRPSLTSWNDLFL